MPYSCMRRIAIALALSLVALTCCADDQPAPSVPVSASSSDAVQAPDPDAAGSRGRWPASIDLPEVATVGALPPIALRIDIGVDAAGTITVDGETTDLDGLYERVKRFAHAPADGRYSDAYAVIALDASLPWIVGVRCQCRCSWAGIYRTFFAVRDAHDRSGALAVFVPRAHAGRHVGPWFRFLSVRIDETDTPARPSEIGAELRAAQSGGENVGVLIEGEASAPVGLVLTVVGSAAEAGARVGQVLLRGDLWPEREPADDVRLLASRAASNHASIGRWGDGGMVAAHWPPPAELTSRYVGLFASGDVWFADETDDK